MWSAANADPDGQWVLHRARVDALPCQRGAMFTRPVDEGIFADVEEQVKLLGEERIVIVEIVSEKEDTTR